MSISKASVVTKINSFISWLDSPYKVTAGDVNELKRVTDELVDTVNAWAVWEAAPLMDRMITFSAPADSYPFNTGAGQLIDTFFVTRVLGANVGTYIQPEFAVADYLSGAEITFNLNTGDIPGEVYFNTAGGFSACALDISPGAVFLEAKYLIATKGTMRRVGNFVELRNCYFQEYTTGPADPFVPGPTDAFVRYMLIPFTE